MMAIVRPDWPLRWGGDVPHMGDTLAVVAFADLEYKLNCFFYLQGLVMLYAQYIYMAVS